MAGQMRTVGRTTPRLSPHTCLEGLCSGPHSVRPLVPGLCRNLHTAIRLSAAVSASLPRKSRAKSFHERAGIVLGRTTLEHVFGLGPTAPPGLEEHSLMAPPPTPLLRSPRSSGAPHLCGGGQRARAARRTLRATLRMAWELTTRDRRQTGGRSLRATLRWAWQLVTRDRQPAQMPVRTALPTALRTALRTAPLGGATPALAPALLSHPRLRSIAAQSTADDSSCGASGDRRAPALRLLLGSRLSSSPTPPDPFCITEPLPREEGGTSCSPHVRPKITASGH